MVGHSEFILCVRELLKGLKQCANFYRLLWGQPSGIAVSLLGTPVSHINGLGFELCLGFQFQLLLRYILGE